jgi:hypothetical protein
MNAQSLRQINGSGGDGYICHFDSDHMERLIAAIDKNTTATSAQNDNYKQITKYLLIVVCVIAVGQKALEAARDIWGNKSTTVVSEVKHP